MRPPGRSLVSALAGVTRRAWRRGHAWRRARQPDATRRVLQDIWRRVAHVELAEFALVADSHHDQIDLALERLIHDGRADVAGLQNLGFHVDAELVGDMLSPRQDGVTLGGLRRQIDVER